jgi:hypothetical protein
MRIAHRWDAINLETEAREQARPANKKYIPELLENGDLHKQLLAGSRYLLFKPADKWMDKQKQSRNKECINKEKREEKLCP